MGYAPEDVTDFYCTNGNTWDGTCMSGEQIHWDDPAYPVHELIYIYYKLVIKYEHYKII
jgi:hypothetical protein